MSSKKKNPTTRSTSQPTLKIGSQVRCTDDGIRGRIVWANGSAVKIQWQDGEQVTWKRDSLSERPIEILDADDTASAEPQAETSGMPAVVEQARVPGESVVPVADVPITETIAESSIPGGPFPASPPALSAGEPLVATESSDSTTPVTEAAAAEESSTVTERHTRRKVKKSDAASGCDKKLSALDGAAKVLAEVSKPMTCQEMIEAMANKGYWTSPGGKTPAATLYSAVAREITTRGSESRFVKTERGRFARNAGS